MRPTVAGVLLFHPFLLLLLASISAVIGVPIVARVLADPGIPIKKLNWSTNVLKLISLKHIELSD